MKVLLISVQYPPEIGSASKLIQELALTLAGRGHEVTILTTMPRYKLGEEDSLRSWDPLTIENGIKVLRIKTWMLAHVGYIKRGLATFIAPLQLYFGLKKYGDVKYDIVFIYSPPITFGLIGSRLKKYGAKFILNVQDIFPQNAIDLGLLKNSFLISLFKKIEKKCYVDADVVTAHSLGNKEFIDQILPNNKDKLKILHNWIDINFSPPMHIDFRALYNLKNKFICVFAGVMGPSQGLDKLLEAALLLRDIKDLVILLVGDGTQKEYLQNFIYENQLKNVMLKGFISQENYLDLLKSVDVGIVSLSENVKTPVVPGKMLGYMAASLPVAAFVNDGSDVHDFIVSSGAGLSCLSSNPIDIANILRYMYENQEQIIKMGVSGREYVVENFDKEKIVTEIESFF